MEIIFAKIGAANTIQNQPSAKISAAQIFQKKIVFEKQTCVFGIKGRIQEKVLNRR